MTGSTDLAEQRALSISLLNGAIRECCGWTFRHVASLPDEPTLPWSNDSHPPHDRTWCIEVSSLQAWDEDDIHVIQITISIHDEPLHFGTVIEFYSDDRAATTSDISEFVGGVPRPLEAT